MLTFLSDESCTLIWPEDAEDQSRMVQPGDNVEMVCEIHNPLAIEVGQRFNVREGGRLVYNILVGIIIILTLVFRTVATGLITRLYD